MNRTQIEANLLKIYAEKRAAVDLYEKHWTADTAVLTLDYLKRALKERNAAYINWRNYANYTVYIGWVE